MRGLRTRLVMAVLATVAIGFAVLIGAFNLVLANRLSHDADDVLRARADAALSSLATKDGRVVVRQSPDGAAIESSVWIFARHRQLEGSRSNRAIGNAAARLADGPRRFKQVPGHDTRLYAVPITSGGTRLGTVVAAVSLVPYEHTEHVALIASVILVFVLLAVLAVVARWIVALALRPVAEMTAQAAHWSERDFDRRFDLGQPHDELTTLAATLDNLLGRVAASLRHEQRFSSEVSHELRTPLAKVRAEAELALRHTRTGDSYREALRHVLAGADQMGSIIDTLLVVAREEANPQHATADAREAAMHAAACCAEVAAARGIVIDVSGAGHAPRVATDANLVERILVPVLENACHYGERRVTLAAERGPNGTVTYTVQDDGPGVTQADVERIFEPGVRGPASNEHGGIEGAGLGLALARRLARAAHGDVEAHADERGGNFTVVLPAA